VVYIQLTTVLSTTFAISKCSGQGFRCLQRSFVQCNIRHGIRKVIVSSEQFSPERWFVIHNHHSAI